MGLYSIPNLSPATRRVMILNWKGGCGKSMIATNLAGYYAVQGRRTALIDHDPQGTSIRWLKLRNGDRPIIHGVNASQRASQVTRSFLMRVPPGTERVVIDTPAGVRGYDLQELVRQSDRIIIPVLPSDADIHAAAGFIGELLLDAKVRTTGAKVGVVANRVRENTRIYRALLKFLAQLDFPLITAFRDTQNYIHAAEQGLCIHEIQPASRVQRDLGHWSRLVGWIESTAPETSLREASAVV
jgi:chromosome partitioning protein